MTPPPAHAGIEDWHHWNIDPPEAVAVMQIEVQISTAGFLWRPLPAHEAEREKLADRIADALSWDHLDPITARNLLIEARGTLRASPSPAPGEPTLDEIARTVRAWNYDNGVMLTEADIYAVASLFRPYLDRLRDEAREP